MTTQAAPSLPGLLAKIETFVGYTVVVHDLGYRYEMHIRDASGSRDIEFLFDTSNSKQTFGIHKMHSPVNRYYLSEWDPLKVRAVIIWTLAHSTEPKAAEKRLLKELRQNPECPMPALVTQIEAKIYEVYVKKMGGDDLKRRVDEIKSLLDAIKDQITEEDLLQWYRELIVKKVMES